MADYRAVLAAINALGANQRDHALRLDALAAQASEHHQEFRSFRRSVEDQLGEIKDLIIGR